jgi:hypothetical protein
VAGVAGISWVLMMFINPGAAHDADSIAAKFDVQIVWQNRVLCAGPDDRVAGCFTPAAPDTIFVRTGQTPELERYIVLHELGHVIQYRLGLDRDECGADRFAQSMGSTYGNYCAPVN